MSETPEDEVFAPELDEFLMEPALVQRWLELAADSPIEIALPRVTLDMLYRSIEDLYMSQMHVLQALLATAGGGSIDLNQLKGNVAGRLVNGVNALRHFQTIIMAEATHTKLDDNLRISEEPSDGQ